MVVVMVVTAHAAAARRHGKERAAGILAAQYSLAGVNLAAAGPSRAGLAGLGRALEHCEGAQVLGIATVGDTRYGIVLPVQEASFNGWLEAAEYFHISEFARLVAAALVGGAAAAAIGLVRLYLQDDD